MNKICTIAVYYGRFNNYFRLWLRSCEYNPSIDFLIVTDIVYKETIPSNVKFINLSFEDVKRRVADVTELNIDMPSPYKLCDIRPLYGLVFKDILSSYQYWGHNDLDMIFGDIDYFLNKYSYSEYDKFLPLGHLSFYKNTNEVNNYYKLSGSRCGDYKHVLETCNRTLAFDENIGINSILLANNKKLFCKRIFADISSKYFRYRLSDKASIDGAYEKNYKKQIFYWENGHVYRDYIEDGLIHTQEFIYIHLYQRPNFEINLAIEGCNAFFITSNGFIPKTGKTTEEMIDKYNTYHSYFFELLEYYKWYLRKIMKKISRI